LQASPEAENNTKIPCKEGCVVCTE